MSLEILKIKKDNIFCEDFNSFSKNNIIDFNEARINAAYAPNGVGKSSLCRVLEGQGEFLLNYNNNAYDNSNCNIFHIINDQNSRNIIKGEAKDFLLGDDIVKEFNLKEWIDNSFANTFSNLKNKFNEDLNISKKSDEKIRWLDANVIKIVESIVARGATAENIDIDDFINTISKMDNISIEEYELEKMKFIKSDMNIEVINQILNIKDITKNEDVSKLEQYDDAISILYKYYDSQNCIVCDNENIDTDSLLTLKQEQEKVIINNLSASDKKILEIILTKFESEDDDVFDIKETLMQAITTGNIEVLEDLIDSLNYYKDIYKKIAKKYLKDSLSTEFVDKYNEYKKILNNPLKFSDEDILFIEEFIADNINKEIKLERKDNKIVITMDSDNLLGVERKDLKLSSGEQNFISLTFELLKAKNSDKEIVIIDDPISSFDSIFKNKLVFAIVKFLSKKNILILTHNIDLIRLVEFQNKDDFGIYLFNNFEGQENGFIKISNFEKKMMISIPELLKFIRSSEIDSEIKNERLFLYSLIPFMRGYSVFIDDCVTKQKLIMLMHGYKTEIVNLTEIYNNVFSKNLTTIYDISVNDILSIDIDNLPEIINSEKYPLFNKVLTNNLIYLYLRLKTEKVLADKYQINTDNYDQLSSIIYEAYKSDNEYDKKMRIFFYSKKSLLNEFNHFDGNMSIFQPAIDISEEILNKEKQEILNKLNSI